MRIDGNSVIVTGGAGGLGEATVRRLHSGGAHVVVADVADERSAALVKELGERARHVHTDASSSEDVLAAIAAAQDMGPLRAVVTAHAGPAIGGRLVGKDGSPLELDGFRTTLESYLTSTYNVMRLAAAAMAASEPEGDSGRGVIITTASIAAFEGQIGQLPYAAAKGGVTAMTLVAARDLAVRAIRVLTIAPGTFFTPAFGMTEEEATTRFGAAIPHPPRMGRPAEYARLVESMIDNDYLNGETVRLDAALRFPPK
ncbi:SDR family NAD(P)-dependent oxidoreductase [Actinocorallia longicatena]|uniref:SDR family NAD(P)-dependent oxidoreductase n=1 Tax=Actinocorallia longicatena TaxID=111803 RepID=A0ABP6QDE3_9ACTN